MAADASIHRRLSKGWLILLVTCPPLVGCGGAAAFVPGTEQWQSRRIADCLEDYGIEAQLSEDGREFLVTAGSNVDGFAPAWDGTEAISVEEALDECV